MDAKAVGVAALRSIRRTPPWRIDALLASCFIVTGLMITGHRGAGYASRDGVAIVLVLVATVPYYGRRLAPLPVFAVSVGAAAALVARGNASGALPMVVAVGAYTVAVYRPLPEVVAAAVWLNAALVVMLFAGNPGFHLPEFVTSVAAFAAAMLAGWTMQSRRSRLDALEREQGEAARRAAADERLRIAQELHDVVAHSLGVIAVQAGVGMHVIDTDPAEARRSLEHISRVSRSSLAEIRRLLGLVRANEVTVHEPMPGLRDLRRLARDVTYAGLPVALDVADDIHDVPAGVELATYRIVQEALTNALRHAHAHQATVRLEAQPGCLRVIVSDDGAGHDDGRTASGHGLVGMRERVAVYGGSLEISSAPEGGVRIDATIPYDDEVSL